MAALKKYAINFENHVGINRNEIVHQYEQADLLVFASLYEGMVTTTFIHRKNGGVFK